MDRIVAFDVETPNTKNDRICAIGLTVIEDGCITDSQHFLVNPECNFDYTCINIHGIRPEDVVDAPVFSEVWSVIGDYFRTHLVVFHSGSCFDLLVLLKTLSAYNIEESLVYYVDTVTIARTMIKDIANHKLPTLCERFSINLDHHNAKSDSIACAKLLCCLVDAGANLDNYIKSFQLNMSEGSGRKHTKQRLSSTSQALLVLNGILSGITCDNLLVESEVTFLQSWLEENAALQGNYPYDKVYEIIANALEDGVITSSELDYMLGLFMRITNPVADSSCDCDNLDISGKNICLSGEFHFGSKSDVSAYLSSHGAYIHKDVIQKTDILVVGGQGSDNWSSVNYGNKVKKALEMQRKGNGIQLYREADFFTTIGG